MIEKYRLKKLKHLLHKTIIRNMNNTFNANDMLEFPLDFTNLIQSVSTIFFSISISFYMVSLFYKYNNKSEVSKIESETIIRKKYFYKYKDLFDLTLPLHNIDKLDLKNKFIKDETTRKDIIILGYNKENEIFEVWYDNNKITFLELDTLAQLFCVENNCKNICVNYENEIKLAKSKSLSELEKIKNLPDQLNKSSVFVSFKKYNLKNNKNKTKIIPENCNKFKLKGKIKDWENIYLNNGEWIPSTLAINALNWKQINEKKEIEKIDDSLSWSKWKEMNK